MMLDLIFARVPNKTEVLENHKTKQNKIKLKYIHQIQKQWYKYSLEMQI